MKKINKNIIIALIFMLIGGVYLALLCSNAYALRVPLNDDYAELDRAMLSNLTALELIERIYPNYERYIILLEGFCERIEGNKEISKADIEEYLRLKKRLNIILNIWNSKMMYLWQGSQEKYGGLTDTTWRDLIVAMRDFRTMYLLNNPREGYMGQTGETRNNSFMEWKGKAIYRLTKESNISKKLIAKFDFLIKTLSFEGYTLVNHYDIFVRTGGAGKFVFLRHFHSDLTIRDLFTLIPLRDAELHIFCGSHSFTEEDPYRYYIENYGEIVMQIDENGLFSVPAVDEYIARTIGAGGLNTAVQPRLASNENLPLGNSRILIVQDDHITVSFQKDALINKGANEENIIIVSDWGSVVAALQKHEFNFDAIILDMGFPIVQLSRSMVIIEGVKDGKWSGISVIERLIANNKTIPVVIYSNKVNYWEDVLEHIDRTVHPKLFELTRQKKDMPDFITIQKSGYSIAEDMSKAVSVIEEMIKRNAIKLKGKATGTSPADASL